MDGFEEQQERTRPQLCPPSLENRRTDAGFPRASTGRRRSVAERSLGLSLSKRTERTIDSQTLATQSTRPLNRAGSPGPIGGFRGFCLRYRCRNCNTTEKLFAFVVEVHPPHNIARVCKLGEWPPFGEQIPKSAMKLIELDRQLFLQGRKAENRGLGIGALTYYRRVLDNQKARIIDEILKVARVLDAPGKVIEDLEWARDAWQFEAAVDRIKDAIPDSLRIDGQNPLLLLHRALSEGIHDLPDAECLHRAQAVRIVLTELGRRVELALQDRSEVHEAVKELMKLEEKRGSADPATLQKGEAQAAPKSP